jgi:Leu/Phe-tRNA-protein transferase
MRKKNRVEEILIKKHFKRLNDDIYYLSFKESNVLIYEKANSQEKNPQAVVDWLLEIGVFEGHIRYMTQSSDLPLVKELLVSGFQIYLERICINKYSKYWFWDNKSFNNKYILSKLMMNGQIYEKYTILSLNNVHEPKSALRLLKKYELKPDFNFDIIVDKCSEIHGIKSYSQETFNYYKRLYREKDERFKFISFALYRDNELKAGEFGCIIGKIYFSYCGYHEESSSGTVQMIKMFRFLKEESFTYCNLGATTEKYKYKYRFGAIDISRNEYLKLLYEQNN